MLNHKSNAVLYRFFMKFKENIFEENRKTSLKWR